MVNTPSPRTVANVGKLLNAGMPKSLEYEIISGAAGEGFAAEFLGFLKIFRSLPNPDMVLMAPDAAEVPTDPATLYALSGALAHRASEQNFSNLTKYSGRMPAEFSVLTIKDCITRNPQLTNTPGFITWAVDHQNILI